MAGSRSSEHLLDLSRGVSPSLFSVPARRRAAVQQMRDVMYEHTYQRRRKNTKVEKLADPHGRG